MLAKCKLLLNTFYLSFPHLSKDFIHILESWKFVICLKGQLTVDLKGSIPRGSLLIVFGQSKEQS